MTILKIGRTKKTTNNKTLRSGGMTLLEVLLAVSIFVFLVGVTAIGLRLLSSRGSISDAVKNFAVGLRMTRAEAASQGKRFRLTFDEELGGKILLETDPISSPGQFVEYAECTWNQRLINPHLRVTGSILTGPSAFSTLGQIGDIGDEGKKIQSITFNADGSCDSAEITLKARDEDDSRSFIVKLDGMTGKTTIKIKDSTEENNITTEDE